jgi:nucleoid-associated protein YgaU
VAEAADDASEPADVGDVDGRDEVSAQDAVAVEATEETGASAEAEVGATVIAPRVDTLRVEPDGMTVIAGRAAPGATVAVMLGAAMVSEVVADAGGAFVALVMLPASDQPRALSLVAEPEGAAVESDGTWLIAPTVAPQTAAADVDLGTEGAVTDPAAGAEIVAGTTDDLPPDEPVESEQLEVAALAPEATSELPSPDVTEELATTLSDEAGLAEPEAVAEEQEGTLVADGAAGVVDLEAGVQDVTDGDAVQAGVTDQVPVAEAVASVAALSEPEQSAEEVAGPDVVAVDAPLADEAVSGESEDGSPGGGSIQAAAISDTPEDSAAAAVGEAYAPASSEEAAVVDGAAVADQSAGEGSQADAVSLPVADAGAQPSAAALETVAPEVTVDVAGLAAPATTVATAPPVLVSDAEGVRVVQPALSPGAGPEVLATVAVDAIVYDPAGGVGLSGRAGGGGTVRIYLDNAPVADVVVDGDGQWEVDLTAVDPGLYTLRVDQIDAAGAVTSRVETPFLREERDSIAAVMAEETGAEGFDVAVQTVQPGNTLWAIARDRYGDGIMYVQVFEANRDRIRNPDLIYPGQIFLLPESATAP